LTPKSSISNQLSQSLKAAGREQNRSGQEQEAKGQLSDFGSGMANRAQGLAGSAISGITGDSEAQARYNEQRAEGKTQQRGAEYDMQKQAEAHQ
jgi:hypothetical protein